MSAADTYERYMLTLINAERAKVGAGALKLETNLNASAEAHSEWMLQTDIFSHTGVNGTSATQRMNNADFDFSGAWRTAENIAVQSERGAGGIKDDVYDLHVALMNSAGHRANILNPKLDYIGIGIELGQFDFGPGEFTSVIVTQNFASTGGKVDLDPYHTGSKTTSDSDNTKSAGIPKSEKVTGGNGNDVMKGKSGADWIAGGKGNDKVSGGGGKDVLEGKSGNDQLFGGKGADKIDGGSGKDRLFGEAGSDKLEGKSGSDKLNGGKGKDALIGGAGKDTLNGGSGNDSLKGGEGQDKLKGGDGKDRLEGGRGSDVVDGGKSNDSLAGGANDDTFVFKRGYDTDRIKDFQNNVDEINLRSFDFDSVSEALSFARQSGKNVEFDFGRGDKLIVEDITISALGDDLLI